MKYDEFKQSLLNEVIKTKPKQFRLGQAVFNYVDDKYGIARDVQFEDHIDCFYYVIEYFGTSISSILMILTLTRTYKSNV